MATLAQLRDRVRQRADMENTDFVTAAELTTYVQNSYAELYDVLTTRFEDYFSKDVEFTATEANPNHPLPADFFKLRGVDLQTDASSQEGWVTLRQWNFAERNDQNRVGNRYGISRPQYRVMGSNLRLMPASRADGSYRLWYIPTCPLLALDTDQMDASSAIWDEYVVVDAAIKCLVKEESDISALDRAKALLLDRIITAAASRNVGAAERVADVSYDGLDAGWFGRRQF